MPAGANRENSVGVWGEVEEAEAAEGDVSGGGVDSVELSRSLSASIAIPDEDAFLGVSVALSVRVEDACRGGVREVDEEDGAERKESTAE